MADNQKKKNIIPKNPQRQNYQVWIIVTLIALIFGITYLNKNSAEKIFFSDFKKMMEQGDVKNVVLIKNQDKVEIELKEDALKSERYREVDNNSYFPLSEGPHYYFKITTPDKFDEKWEEFMATLPEEERKSYEIEDRQDFWQFFASWGILFLILFGFWFLMRRMTGSGGPGGQIFNIGKSRAALFDAENKVKITFDNVAGLDEAKEEVKEIVEFLKTPSKFTKLGGKIPKGALLVGPPGYRKDIAGKSRGRRGRGAFFQSVGLRFCGNVCGGRRRKSEGLVQTGKRKSALYCFY